jgi:hypothetical protein
VLIACSIEESRAGERLAGDARNPFEMRSIAPATPQGIVKTFVVFNPNEDLIKIDGHPDWNAFLFSRPRVTLVKEGYINVDFAITTFNWYIQGAGIKITTVLKDAQGGTINAPPLQSYVTYICTNLQCAPKTYTIRGFNPNLFDATQAVVIQIDITQAVALHCCERCTFNPPTTCH